MHIHTDDMNKMREAAKEAAKKGLPFKIFVGDERTGYTVSTEQIEDAHFIAPFTAHTAIGDVTCFIYFGDKVEKTV